MEIKEQVQMLRGFFGTLFQPEDKVFIYPSLSDGKLKYYKAHLDELPEILHQRHLSWERDGHRNLRKFLKPFMVEPASIDADTVSQLRDLNELGYDIYFVANPLLCSKRCQKTVRVARHLVIESDIASLDNQWAVLEKYKDFFSALIFTGNKSYHAYAAIDPPMRNPNCVGYGEIRKLGKDTSAKWKQYVDLAKCWIEEMRGNGIDVDPLVIKDYSRVSRVPGFKHAKTGKECEIKRLNPQALDFFPKNYANDDIALILGSDESGRPQIPSSPEKSCRVQLESPLVPYWYLGTAYRFSSYSGSWRVEGAWRNIVMTDLKPGSTYLDDLEIYWQLKRYGIPRRHERIRLHKALFTVARVFCWSKEKLGEEWLSIVKINPNHIGCSKEEAVEDICRHFNSAERLPIYLPNATTIPEPNVAHEIHLESSLEEMQCPDITNTKRLIVRVLLPLIKQFPVQCCRGMLGIKSKDMLLATIKGKYTPALTWMLQNRLISMTRKGYFVGIMTRTYAVNIPLILFLMGYGSKELDWSKAMAWDVAILGDIAA